MSFGGGMPSRRFFPAVVTVMLSVVLATHGLAQSSSGGGSVVGTVKDQTGAVVPNAKVQVVNLETTVAQASITNADGYFSTATIIIGKYRVHVEAAGMKAWQGEIRL